MQNTNCGPAGICESGDNSCPGIWLALVIYNTTISLSMFHPFCVISVRAQCRSLPNVWQKMEKDERWVRQWSLNRRRRRSAEEKRMFLREHKRTWNSNNNNNNILYSSQREIKAVVWSHNEEHISIIIKSWNTRTRTYTLLDIRPICLNLHTLIANPKFPGILLSLTNQNVKTLKFNKNH